MAPRRPACFVSTGSVLIDLPLHVSRMPAPGGAVTALSTGPVVGGGYTVVSAVARQGVPAALAATLGTGPNSAQVRDSMMRDQVELAVDELVGDIGTCTTLIEPDGRRTFITTEGVGGEPQLEDLERIELQDGDYVYATGYDLAHARSRPPLLTWLSRLPEGVGLVVDLGPAEPDIPDEVLARVLARATILTGNDHEIESLLLRLGGCEALRAAAPSVLMVRRTGARGCELYPVDHDPIGVAGFSRDVVDTTGAGDTHTGVLVASLMEGLDIVSAARRANAAAALAVLRHGPARAPRRGPVDELLAEAERAPGPGVDQAGPR